MSLFVGRLSKKVRKEQIESLFAEKGKLKRCDLRGNHCFVTYEDDRDAESAIRDLQDHELEGYKMSIEWTKESGRSHENRPRDNPPRERAPRGPQTCFTCGREGHVRRDCPSSRGDRPPYDARFGSYAQGHDRRDDSRRGVPYERDYRARDDQNRYGSYAGGYERYRDDYRRDDRGDRDERQRPERSPRRRSRTPPPRERTRSPDIRERTREPERDRARSPERDRQRERERELDRRRSASPRRDSRDRSRSRSRSPRK